MSIQYDPLSEYHLYNPELKLYGILEEIKSLIEESRTREIRNNGNKKKEIIDKIQNLLNEPAGKRILEMICRKNNTKFDSQQVKNLDGESTHNPFYKNPNILLQILFIHAVIDSYSIISQNLDIDPDEAKAAIEYLKSIFNLEDALVWLQNFLNKDTRYRKMRERNILLGQESVNQPNDTSEERKLKMRRQAPSDSSGPSSKK